MTNLVSIRKVRNFYSMHFAPVCAPMRTYHTLAHASRTTVRRDDKCDICEDWGDPEFEVRSFDDCSTLVRRLFKIQNAPRLARNAPFAHLGAPRACQSVCLSVCVAKNGTPGVCLGGKRPENGRNATGLGLPRPDWY